MPREFIQGGLIYFRTKLLPVLKAYNFCRCLRANPLFTDVEWIENDKGNKGFVQYRPVNPDRQWDAVDRQKAAREKRAQTEGSRYQWFLDTDVPGHPFYHCLSVSGEVYQVTPFDCDCPDFVFRCSKLSHVHLRCKHILALEAAYTSGAVVPLGEVLSTVRVPVAFGPVPYTDAPVTRRENR